MAQNLVRSCFCCPPNWENDEEDDDMFDKMMICLIPGLTWKKSELISPALAKV